MAGRDVRAVELPRAGSPESLTRIVASPQVEIDHLWPVDGRETDDLPGLHRKAVPRPHRDDDITDLSTTIDVGGKSGEQRGVGHEWAVACGDVGGVRHVRSMAYATRRATRTAP